MEPSLWLVFRQRIHSRYRMQHFLWTLRCLSLICCFPRLMGIALSTPIRHNESPCPLRPSSNPKALASPDNVIQYAETFWKRDLQKHDSPHVSQTKKLRDLPILRKKTCHAQREASEDCDAGRYSMWSTGKLSWCCWEA